MFANGRSEVTRFGIHILLFVLAFSVPSTCFSCCFFEIILQPTGKTEIYANSVDADEINHLWSALFKTIIKRLQITLALVADISVPTVWMVWLSSNNFLHLILHIISHGRLWYKNFSWAPSVSWGLLSVWHWTLFAWEPCMWWLLRLSRR